MRSSRARRCRSGGTGSPSELLRKGTITVKGKTRRLREDDADFFGTSYVFVRYDTDTNERLLVRHFGRLEWVRKGNWAVWVAANPSRTP